MWSWSAMAKNAAFWALITSDARSSRDSTAPARNASHFDQPPSSNVSSETSLARSDRLLARSSAASHACRSLRELAPKARTFPFAATSSKPKGVSALISASCVKCTISSIQRRSTNRSPEEDPHADVAVLPPEATDASSSELSSFCSSFPPSSKPPPLLGGWWLLPPKNLLWRGLIFLAGRGVEASDEAGDSFEDEKAPSAAAAEGVEACCQERREPLSLKSRRFVRVRPRAFWTRRLVDFVARSSPSTSAKRFASSDFRKRAPGSSRVTPPSAEEKSDAQHRRRAPRLARSVSPLTTSFAKVSSIEYVDLRMLFFFLTTALRNFRKGSSSSSSSSKKATWTL
mmetsp:Transcript_29032/g.93623  ORF Transcript_29032/g.93623 Transcript_29032/m.93623 type:complete len:343 (-) Transcript_29032:627-1655(-)